ncbi:zinc finger protein CONSTANS isoform X1 [Capsella rubella]|uniref:zinc finger protein CONSTANS isoform X1 n=1 Tax=Capsella rubella TaxID=81985 RepID=UPI000CD587DF|nr:zinc finger protein CONSTANS isoform X1 [Capsella rubella]
MLIQESNDISSGENNRARACDTCRSNVSTVYCHADSAYLCMSCDAQVHSANRVASRHKRVGVCESCERAPAAFLCEADDASLCTACDSEVHSANPLARRHHRVPILPISGNSYSSMATHHRSERTMDDQEKMPVVDEETSKEANEDAKEVVSWLFPNSDKNSGNHNNNNQNNVLLFSDAYTDLADHNSSMDYQFTGQYNQQEQDCGVPQTSYGGDRVVPLQLEESRGHLNHNEHNFQFDITYGSSGSHYTDKGSQNNNSSYQGD